MVNKRLTKYERLRTKKQTFYAKQSQFSKSQVEHKQSIKHFGVLMTKNLCNMWLKIREISVNPWLINDLRSTKDYVRKNNLFMQNEPKFRKSQMNVNKVLTKDYEIMDTWSSGKNEPKTNPNEPKTNPIKANIMPKQTQNKAKQSQCLPAISVADQARFTLCGFFLFSTFSYPGCNLSRSGPTGQETGSFTLHRRQV